MFHIPHDPWCCLTHTVSIEIPWISGLAPFRAIHLKRGGRADFIGGQRNWVSQVAVVVDPQLRILGISDSQYI